MIVTVTPNPSVDRTLEVDGIVRGEVVRSRGLRVDPGGKGINVARALVNNGIDAVAVLPAGGAEGRQLVELLRDRGIDSTVVPIAGAIRANISLVEPDGTVTKINESGPVLSSDELDALLDVTADAAVGADWVVTCGRLPAGAPDDLHASLAARARAAGARVAVDTSGRPLLAALAAEPDLIKPNRDELAEATGTTIDTVGAAVAAARRLQTLGARDVLVSLGVDGALLVARDVVHLATHPSVQPVSSVGAGDSALAGFLTASDPIGALRAAVAYGTAAVQLPGTALPTPADLHPELVRVTDLIDLDAPLSGGARGGEVARLGVR